MLTAILHGKAGRIQLQGEETRVRWREVFQRSEDLLTSVFFSRLRYLSPASTTRVMALLVGEKAASALGELQGITFWPRLEGTNGRSWVEPDVQMQFSKALVMVEVKPPFGGVQRLEQWRAQIRALAQDLTEEDAAPQLLHFVALGNNTLELDAQTPADWGVAEAFIPVLHQAEWHDIAHALPGLQVNAIASDRADLDDLRDAFALFGIAVQPAFQWPELLAWAGSCGLSTAEVPWPVWSAPPPTPAPTLSKAVPAGGVDWHGLLSFSINHPLHFP